MPSILISAGGPAFDLAGIANEEGAPSLRFLQGWGAVLSLADDMSG
jgi:hypothetical protein